MPDSFLCANRFRRPARIHHAADPHHPRVPPANVGHGLCHPLPLLPHFAPWLPPGLRVDAGFPSGLPRHDFACSARAAGGDSRSTSCCRRHGSASRTALPNHVAILDLYSASGGGSFPVPFEFRLIFGGPPPEVARDRIRTDLSRPDACAQPLKKRSLPHQEKNASGKQFLLSRQVAISTGLPLNH